MERNLPHLFVSGLTHQRRSNVVAQALMEKLDKISVARLTLEREQAQLKEVVASLARKIAEIDAEAAELKAALGDYEVAVNSALGYGDLLSNQCLHDNKNWFHTGGSHDLHSESRQQKQAVIDTVKTVLELAGPTSTKVLYEIVHAQKLPVPSKERLSQILSEASQFEADRTKGWSLKGEKPGVR